MLPAVHHLLFWDVPARDSDPADHVRASGDLQDAGPRRARGRVRPVRRPAQGGSEAVARPRRRGREGGRLQRRRDVRGRAFHELLDAVRRRAGRLAAGQGRAADVRTEQRLRDHKTPTYLTEPTLFV